MRPPTRSPVASRWRSSTTGPPHGSTARLPPRWRSPHRPPDRRPGNRPAGCPTGGRSRLGSPDPMAFATVLTIGPGAPIEPLARALAEEADSYGADVSVHHLDTVGD